MKGIKPIEMKKEEAKVIWKEYCEGLKGKTGFVKEYYALKSAYHALKDGKRVLDLTNAFNKAGLTGFGEPRLAIAPLAYRRIRFHARRQNEGTYNINFQKPSWNYSTSFNDYVRLENCELRFPNSPDGKPQSEINLEANVPLVPPKFLPKNPKGYFVLWEVGKWEKWKQPPRDPFLLKRLSDNLFVIVAYWDLTKLERAVLRRA